MSLVASDFKKPGRGPALVDFASAFRHSSTRLDRTLGPNEAFILSAIFVLIYVAYASLGRDVFFSHSNLMRGQVADDPMGQALPYVRVFFCATIVFGLSLRMGAGWVFERIPVLFAPFAFLTFASTLWSDETRTVLIQSSGLLLLWMALPPLVQRLGIVPVTRLTLLMVAWVLIFSLALAVLVPSIGVHTGAEAYQSSHVGRWRGIFSHKNGLGFWASFGATLLFSSRGLFKGFSKIIATMGWLAGIACLIFARSSTSIVIACLLITCIFLINMLKAFSKTIVATTTIFVLIAFGILLYFGSDYVFAVLERDATFSGRTQLWGLALDFIAADPWLGTGYQSLAGARFADYTIQFFGEPLGPENGYLGIVLDLGVFGLIFFLAPLILGLRNAVNWIPHIVGEERLALETMFLIVLATCFQSLVDATAFIATGYDGVIAFSAFFMFMAMQKSPLDVARSEQRLARSWVKRREALISRKRGERLAMEGLRRLPSSEPRAN
jgi:exopolysaccharide production protein ExoQ